MSLSLTPLELVWCPHATDTEQVWRVRIISGRWGFIFHLFSTQKNYSNTSPSEWQHNPLMHSWASYQVPSPELCNGWKIAGEGMSCSLGSLSASQFSQRSAWRYWPHCGHRCRLCAELRLLQHPGNADSLVWCSKLDPAVCLWLTFQMRAQPCSFPLIGGCRITKHAACWALLAWSCHSWWCTAAVPCTGGCLPSYCHTVVKGLLWSKSDVLSISLLCWNSRSTQALSASFSIKSPCLDPNTTSPPCLPCPPLTALVFHEDAIFPPVFMIIFLPILLSSWRFLLVPLFTVCRGLGSSYLRASSLLNKALRLHSLPLRYSNWTST